MKLLLGIDLGTSSVKVSVLDADSGKTIASAQYPDTENPILSLHPGWAEQSPDTWWEQVLAAIGRVVQSRSFDPREVCAIGIAYQMHGLVCLNKKGEVLRNSIIWCDSRAIPYGARALQQIGREKALHRLLNAPGNFTAAKLAWVKEQEPDCYRQIDKVMLPGDFIAFRLTGNVTTTPSALSEGIFWDFQENRVSAEVMEAFGFDPSILPPLQDVFSIHGTLSRSVADQTGLREGIPVSYKAGDQPNNAFALNVLQPGDIAATAGTSGVVYGVTDRVSHDPASRVNSFLHVNHRPDQKRIGVLLCVNGTGILYSWMRQQFFQGKTYPELNEAAAKVAPGGEGLLMYPFGNGAERVLNNQNPGASVQGLQFNRHHAGHLARAAQEGIAFALHYGIGIMREMGLSIQTVRAGHANLFLSPVFREAFANTTGCKLELYNTDGSQGAARAAGWGAGLFSRTEEVFIGMDSLMEVQPDSQLTVTYTRIYEHWKEQLIRSFPSLTIK